MAIALIVGSLFAGGVESADKIASIVAAILLCLGILGLIGQTPYSSDILDIAPRLRHEVREVWRPEASVRRALGRQLIPVRVEAEPSPGREATLRYPVSPDAMWTSAQYQAFVVDLMRSAGSRRLLVTGPAGAGKTTLALLLTLGLLRDSADLPILLPIASWDAGRESFPAWCDRQLQAIYKSARLIRPRANQTRLATLLHSGARVVIVLDGLDELSQQHQASALRQIDESIPDDQIVVIFSREPSNPSPGVGGNPFRHLRLIPPPPAAIDLYLQVRAEDVGVIDAWRRLRNALRHQPEGALYRVLRVPLFMEMTCEALAAEFLTEQELVDAANTPAESIQSLITSRFLGHHLRRIRRFPVERVIVWARRIAIDMDMRSLSDLAWWRLQDFLPKSLIAGIIGVSMLPFYGMCLLLPNGLTRGLATGLVAALAFALLDGVKLTARSAILAGGVSMLCVGAVGFLLIDWHDWTMDVLQLGLALTLSILLKDRLLGRAAQSVPATVAVGVVCSLCVATARFLFPELSPTKTLVSVFFSVALGTGLAVIAARLLGGTERFLQPSRVDLQARSRSRSLVSFVPGTVLTAIGVGAAGAIQGAITISLDYGLSLAILYGIAIGLPVGLIVTVVRWLEQPGDTRVTSSPGSTLYGDRVAFMICLVAPGVISAIAAAACQPLVDAVPALQTSPPVTVGPIEGLVLGASIGVVLASFNTRYPLYLVASMWLALRGKAPLRYMTLLVELHELDVLRQEGPVFRFRHQAIQDAFARGLSERRQHEAQ